jgi:hypothetical protein
LYPNPINDIVNLKTKTNIKIIHVFDVSGKLNKTINSGFNKINLSNLKKGTYIVSVLFMNESQEYYKVIKN